MAPVRAQELAQELRAAFGGTVRAYGRIYTWELTGKDTIERLYREIADGLTQAQRRQWLEITKE